MKANSTQNLRVNFTLANSSKNEIRIHWLTNFFIGENYFQGTQIVLRENPGTNCTFSSQYIIIPFTILLGTKKYILK